MAFQIIDDSINYKSIDVELLDISSNPLTFIPSTDTFTIDGYSSNDLKVIYNRDNTIATLLIKDNNKLLSLNTEYTVKFLRNSTQEGLATFNLTKPISMDNKDNPTVLIPHGTNFLTIRFPYPINIIDSDIATTSPFYILPEGQQVGFPDAPLNKANGFTWKMSEDFRSVNIESKFFPFNIGKISIFVNYPICSNKARFFRDKSPVVPTLLVGYNSTTSTTDPDNIPDVPSDFGSVTEVSYLTANKILVKFSRAVLLDAQDSEEPIQLGYRNVVYSTDTTAVGTPVLLLSRPNYSDDDGTSLIYEVSQALIEEPVIFTPDVNEVDIYPLLDAYYYPMPTDIVTMTFNNKPNLLSASYDDATKIITLIFDSEMNKNAKPSEISVIDPSNYTIEGYNGLITNVTITSTTGNPTVVQLTLDSALNTGSYNIIVAKTVEDLTGDKIFDNTIELTVGPATDFVIPTIIGFSTTGDITTEDFNPTINKIVIKYDHEMLTSTPAPTDGANNYLNYRLVNVTTPNAAEVYYLNSTSSFINLYEDTNTTFRGTLSPVDNTLPEFTLNNIQIDIGYTKEMPQTLRKVISTKPDLEVQIKSYPINNWATAFNFCNNGDTLTNDPMFVKVSDNSVKYSYNNENNNKFYSVDLTKLTLGLKQNPTDATIQSLTPVSATISDTGKEITFVFAEDMILTGELPSIIIDDTTPTNDGSIKDIFGNGVVINNCDISLEYSSLPIVLSASIVSITPDPDKADNPSLLKTALFFNKQMSYAEGNDFVLYVASQAYDIDVPTASIVEDNRVVELDSHVNPWFTPYVIDKNGINMLMSQMIAGESEANRINTMDIDKNFIKPFIPPITFKNIGMEGFSVKLIDTNTYEFRVSYPYQINVSRFEDKFKDTTGYNFNIVPVYTAATSTTTGSYKVTLNTTKDSVTKSIGVINILHNSLSTTEPTTTLATNPVEFDDNNKSLIIRLVSDIPLANLLPIYFRSTEYALSVLVPDGDNGVTTFVDCDKYISVSTATPNI